MTTPLFSDTTNDLPQVPGPTTDRLLAVRLLHSVQFKGRVCDTINTQRRGFEHYALRFRSVRGVGFLVVAVDDMVRMVPWGLVVEMTPHPDFVFDQGPAVFPPDTPDDEVDPGLLMSAGVLDPPGPAPRKRRSRRQETPSQ